jgi:hypothetical protein
VLKNRRDVGRNKEFAIAQTDDDRRPLSNGDDRVRFIDGDDRQGENSAQLLHRFPHGFLEREIFVIFVVSDQMRDDFGVGLGFERAAVRSKALLQRQVIFDDAVMDNDNLARLIAMRVRIFFGRSSVRRPTRVTDAVISIERMQTNAFLEISQLPFRTTQLEMLMIIDDGDSRRIVPAILELPKTVDNQRHDLFVSNVSDNSTHKANSSPI